MIKRNLSYSMMLALSQLIFPLITFPYASRILGKHGMGSINFIDSFTQYFILFAALGIPIYAVREVAKAKSEPQQLNQLFSEIFVIHALSTIACAVLYFGLALYVAELSVHLELVLISIFIMLFTVLTVEWFYAGIEQFKYITIRSLIVKSASVVLLLLLLKPGSSVAIYYVPIMLAICATGLSNLYFLRKRVSFTLKGLQLRRHLRPLIIILSSSLAVSVYVFIDNILLGFMHGEEAVGLYAVATKIVKIPLALFAAINAVIIPKVSAAFAEERFGEIQSLLAKSFKFLCIIGIPMSVGIFISADLLIRVFAGAQFVMAIRTLKILAPVVFIIGFTLLLAAQILAPYGKEKMLLMVSIVGMCLSLLLNLLFIPRWSDQGAAITNVLTESLVCVLLIVIVRKYANIVFSGRFFFKCLFGTLLFFPIAFAIRSLDVGFVASEMAIVIACGLVYVCYVLFVLRDVDILNLKDQIVSKVLSTLKFN